MEPTFIAAVVSGAITIGLWIDVRIRAKKLHEKFAHKMDAVAEAFNHVADQVNSSTSQILSHTTESSRQTTDEVKTHVVNAVTHLDKHAGHLMEQTEKLKAHARLVLDSGLSASASPRIVREVCVQCRRIVHSFNQGPSGPICHDCLGKKKAS